MNELVEIFNELKNDSSRNGKEAILEEHKDNDSFKDVLKFVYNPYIVTGLSNKKMNKSLNAKNLLEAFKPLTTLREAMDYLEKNNTGRDIDVLLIQDFISKLSTDKERELAKQIFTKSLKVGITEKTINKIHKNMIPSFGCMLAESYAKKESKVTGEFYITLKLDGNRVIAIRENNYTKFFTRKGQQIEGLTELEEEFSHLPNNLVIDGEVLLVNDENLSSDKLFRATQKVIRKDGEKKNLEFHAFDILTTHEFLKGDSVNPYSHRREKLESVIDYFGKSFKFLRYLPVLYKGNDKSMIPVLMKWAEENSYEGLMINTSSGFYKTNRTADLQKVKSFKSADLLCIALEEGTGKNEGKLGALLLQYGDNIVKVGSGFSDEQRIFYWNNPDEVVTKIIEVSYFEESQNQDGGKSLRFPVFKTVRTDKSEDDINID